MHVLDAMGPDAALPAPDVVAMGDVVVDFTSCGVSAGGNRLFECNPGGAPANVAAAVAALGGSASFLGCVGEDDFGDLLKDALDQAGVGTSAMVSTSASGTRLVFIELGEDNERQFKRYPALEAERYFRVSDLDRGLLDRCKLLHVSMTALTSAPIREATLAAIDHVRDQNKPVSFDPNWTAVGSVDPEAERRLILDTTAGVDIVKISADELRFLYPGLSLADGVDELSALGPRLVLVTDGAAGCHYQAGRVRGFQPAFSVEARDTTGAGDTFLGGLLFRLTRSADAMELAKLSTEVVEAVRFASAAAGVAVTRRGSLRAMPALDDVEELLGELTR